MTHFRNDFSTRFKRLNDKQKQAVETIDGPVMVVAGPGTGKTELLSMRVANILRQTDMLASNILCLTFTDSGANAMRQRLFNLIGSEAYKVNIHTFHSFGSEIINSQSEFFYFGAEYKASDQITTYEILTAIFDALPHDNPLSTKNGEHYIHLRDAMSAISDLKKSGLDPNEVFEIIKRTTLFIDWINPKINSVFESRLSKKTFVLIRALLDEVESYKEKKCSIVTYSPLHKLFHNTLDLALRQAIEQNSTKPISSWKKQYLTKTEDNKLQLKDARSCLKTAAVSQIYGEYLLIMKERSMFDFDDMILRVNFSLESYPDLRYNLQEQYQYILVDEFQDTNDAQMRLIWNLTNNPVSEGRPNIMVVGDDDQAIYRFQGANISNILDFRNLYKHVEIITLKDNYRSNPQILDLSRNVILQGQERLETSINIDKKLTAHRASDQPNSVEFNEYELEHDEYYMLAEKISKNIEKYPDSSRAVIARNHKQLTQLIPYLASKNIPLSYERQDNALELEPIIQLELLAQIVQHMLDREFQIVDTLLPRLLAHPAWRIKPKELWQLSLKSHKDRLFWLEAMQNTPGQLSDIAEWLILSSQLAAYQPVEFMLDHLFGNDESQVADTEDGDNNEPFGDGHAENYVSPLRSYFFPSSSLRKSPAQYISHLSALKALRQKVREYRPDLSELLLADFVDCLDLHRQFDININSNWGQENSSKNSISLLTAHKSKGLEFDEVYVVSLTDSVWGNSARSRSSLITFPSNLPLSISGSDSDEKLRLLYVALTRAKDNLYLSSHRINHNNKNVQPVGALSQESIDHHQILSERDEVKASEIDWKSRILDIPSTDISSLLRPILDRYKLSCTHLINYLDVTRGGPELFLLQNLLRFPQAMSPSAAYGSSIHHALQRAHNHLSATGNRRPIEDILHDFEESISSHHLSEEESARLIKRGSDALNTFLETRYDSFTSEQIAERNFSSENIIVDDVKISGMIDLLEIDKQSRTILVTDYKTGRAIRNSRASNEYDKIKLHHYKQQLMFYKLLIENSRNFAGYTVKQGAIEFVEPTKSGEIVRLEYTFSDQDVDEFKGLLRSVWEKIMNLEFTQPDDLPMSFGGILDFEKMLTE